MSIYRLKEQYYLTHKGGAYVKLWFYYSFAPLVWCNTQENEFIVPYPGLCIRPMMAACVKEEVTYSNEAPSNFLPQIKVRINVLFTILVSITAATLYVLFVMCEHVKKISRHYKRGKIRAQVPKISFFSWYNIVYFIEIRKLRNKFRISYAFKYNFWD